MGEVKLNPRLRADASGGAERQARKPHTMQPHKAGRPTGAGRLLILERRARVAAAYLRGLTQGEIARQEGLNQSQIARDLQAVRKEWLSSAVRDLDARLAEEVARL